MPEIAEDERQPMVTPEKIDVTTDDAEQMPAPRTNKNDASEKAAASDMKEIIDHDLEDEQISCAK